MSSEIQNLEREDPGKAEFETRTDSGKGLNEEVVRKISEDKNEPSWMLEKRLKALRAFKTMDMPNWGPDLSEIDLNDITHYLSPDTDKKKDWDELPEEIKQTFDDLGIPDAEKEALGGTGAQMESSVVYQNLKEEWEEKGVIFKDMDQAVQDHPELVKEYFMTKNVPVYDNKFAALHGAVWSGGTFVHVPEGVEVDIPVQAYFRMNKEGMGQFEHTLIIAEPRSQVHYIEGCSAPQYTESNLHAGCVEVFVKEKAHVQYSTVQNWSRNTYNLNTKRAKVKEDGKMEWVSGSIGSKVTMLYPSTHLEGKKATANHVTIAYASDGQDIDTGAKIVHNAEDTNSTIESKSITQGDGRTNYRGLVRIPEKGKGSSVSVECDAMMFNEGSISDTEPYIEVEAENVDMAHEATVGRIGDEQLQYLMSRGLEEEEAKEMIVRGFMEPISKELPLEYAVELNRLIELEMEGSLG